MSQTDGIHICSHFREAYILSVKNGDITIGSTDALGFMDKLKLAGETLNSIGEGANDAVGIKNGKVQEGSLASKIHSTLNSEQKKSALQKAKDEEGAQGLVNLAWAASAASIAWDMWNNYNKKPEDDEEQINKALAVLAKANNGRLLCDNCKSEDDSSHPHRLELEPTL